MKVRAFVHLSNQDFILNDEPIFSNLNVEKGTLPFDAIYNQLGVSYPKFHKMDNLSKLGFLGVEILKKKIDLKKFGPDRIAQIFQNNSSSLDTDLKHQGAIDNGKMPSPAVFVYTLPNIVMGEIAIRNKLYGENLFTLADKFSLENWMSLATVQHNLGKADAVLGGWINLLGDKYNLRLYFIDNHKKNEL